MAKKSPAPLAKLEQAIAKASGIKASQIRWRTKKDGIVEARSVLWWIAVDLMGYGMAELGRLYGYDHTTVLHACRKIRASGKTKLIINGIKKACPEIVFTPKGVNSWNF